MSKTLEEMLIELPYGTSIYKRKYDYVVRNVRKGIVNQEVGTTPSEALYKLYKKAVVNSHTNKIVWFEEQPNEQTR